MLVLFRILIIFFLFVDASYAQRVQPLNIIEVDGSPSTYPYKIKFPNSTVTDNGDSTVSIETDTGVGVITKCSPLIDDYCFVSEGNILKLYVEGTLQVQWPNEESNNEILLVGGGFLLQTDNSSKIQLILQ